MWSNGFDPDAGVRVGRVMSVGALGLVFMLLLILA